MWRIFQDGKKSQLGTRFTLHEVTKKNPEVLRFDRSVTLSLHRRNFRIFFGLNNANLFTETIAPPPHPPAERWLSCRSHQRQLKPKQAQHQLVFRGFTFYIGFYVKLLTAFYNRDAPFKYLHDTTFWCEWHGPARLLRPS